MQFHTGRLVDHIHLRVADLERSRRFYRAALAVLGKNFVYDGPAAFQADELYVDAATDYVTRVHLAFQAENPEMVRAFYEVALAEGGADNGAPGERSYHPGYYAAFVFDPDGNNLEAVWHGPSTRSAPSVVVTPTDGQA